MSGDVFVDVDRVAARLRSEPDTLRFIEVRRDDGEAGPDHHLPNASVATLTGDLSRSDAPPTAGKRPLPHVDDLQAALRRWGVDEDSTVVVYDYDGSFVAARAWWVLSWAGVRDVVILDGGLPAWLAAGHPVGPLATDTRPGDVTVTGGHLAQLDAEQAAALADAGRLLDARTPDAFEAGHIPGAGLASSRDTVDADGTLRDADTLRALYGITSDAADVPGLYCGGGVAAAHGVATLAHLGIAAPLFVGSFSAWSADPVRPVARTPAGQLGRAT
ncbi:sulfurtransferase [Mycobacterium yunnanensis]|uniref:thiosulfate sulfurtransferase n=1 Tax=Mycobacterium yunnanensis TaxID=368477 RepID=A0A9X2YRC2_9MYCO|nr:rhodanese-like domain-containing protein [Mycobacterium yunnanensis]MCV7424048.1 sulfurtransferase [Mycobacterium yunnanensis]